MKIEIPKLLLKLRAEVTEAKQREGAGGMERMAFRIWAWLMTHPRIYLMLARIGGMFAPIVPKVGPLGKWASQREVPRPAKTSFHQRGWKERK